MSQLEDLLQQCTVKLSLPGRGGWGTGFFVAPEWILTCHHVVREANGNPVQVQWQKVELEAVVERALPDPYDLALLRVTLPTDANPTCVWLDAEIRSRDPLYLFGYPDQDFPNGCPATFICEGLTGDEPALVKFALGQVRPGMSGSPLLNQRTGKVCGIVKFTRDRSFDLGGGAVPAAVIFDQFPELVEQQRSLHENDRRWTQCLEGAISSNHVPSFSKRTTLSLSTYDAETWVGRDELIKSLTQKLQDGCRVLAITGITGIGKTALAERLVVEVYRDDMPFHRLNFDDRGQGRDFLSGALTLLPKLDETVTTEDQKDHHTALRHLLQTLRQKPFLVQIDSLEMLLQGDEQTGWNAFTDPLWVDFFQQILAGDTCQSQLLLTSQALSEELEIMGARYPRGWHLQNLEGLTVSEQLQLFEKYGLKPDGLDADVLRRFVELYQGHPLVLQVIARDILEKPFNGNVQQYWNRYQTDFNQLEHDHQHKGSSPRALQLRVKQRVEQALQRLPTDAQHMLCRSSVYRRAVPEKFWLDMMEEFPEDQRWIALELLKSHNLVEQESRGDGVLLLRQHNLVRGAARKLLKMDKVTWRKAELTASKAWLDDYEPALESSKLEKVRGKLEAFHHYCEVEDWEVARFILIEQGLGKQLETWGYFREMIPLYEQILNKLDATVDAVCERCIGNAYSFLSNYPQAITHYQKSLVVACEIGDRQKEGSALGCLGSVYYYLGSYPEALNYYHQHLAIACEIGNRFEKGNALSGIGICYYSLGNYPQAINYSKQHLVIAREIDDRAGEGVALGRLGLNYYSLGNYSQAIEYFKQHLAIAREAGNPFEEGKALTNLGFSYWYLGKYSEAVDHHQQALSATSEISNRRIEGRIIGGLGDAYWRLGNYALAIEYHQQALTIAREISDRQGEGISLCNLGLVYKDLGNYPKAIEYHQQDLVITREIGDRQGEGVTLSSLSSAYCSLEDYAQAIDYCQQALAIAREIGDRQGEGVALIIYGVILINLEKYTEAHPHLQTALKIFTDLGDRANKAEALLRLGEFHYKIGEFNQAKEFCDRALTLAKKLGIPLIRECEELQARLASNVTDEQQEG